MRTTLEAMAPTTRASSKKTKAAPRGVTKPRAPSKHTMHTRGRTRTMNAAPTRRNTVQQRAWEVAMRHLTTQLVTEANRTDIHPNFAIIQNDKMPPLWTDNWRRLATVSRNTRRLAQFVPASIDMFFAIREMTNRWTVPRNKTRERATILGYLQKGANPNYRAGQYGRTALYYASTSDSNLHIVKLLLEHGANPNMKTVQKHGPLAIAERHGASRVAALLRKYGARS